MKKTLCIALGCILFLSGFSLSFAENSGNPSLKDSQEANPALEEVQTGLENNPIIEPIETEDPGTAEPSSNEDENQSEETEKPSDETGTAETPAEPSDQNDVTDTPIVNELISFDDVQNESAYYYNPVYWAVRKGITEGTSNTLFSPDSFCTRAQMITFLWRMEGKVKPISEEHPFQDVPSDAYYKDAVLWAVENGITQGMTEDTFVPEGTCTRAQCVTFLWRINGAIDDGTRTDFLDVFAHSYFVVSVSWAIKNAVTNGMTISEFYPETTCTRGQAMTFIYRSKILAAEKDQSLQAEHLSGSFYEQDVNGTTGGFTLIANGIETDLEIKEAQAVIWKNDDQSDLRWFSMKETGDGSYLTKQNIENFHREFGTYHSSLYLIVSSEEQIYRIHLEDCIFEILPHNYMYSENQGMGRILVTIQGVDSGIDQLNVIAWDRSNGSGAYRTFSAMKKTDGVWNATVDLLSVMDSGVCGLTAVDPKTGMELNIITKELNIKKLIDVSQYQGTINWTTAKGSKRFDGALIRCGLRNNKGKLAKDSKFTYNAQSCTNLGIPMGFYWFTSAISVQEAYQEADYCAALLAPFHLTYPIFIDVERGGRAALNSLSKSKRTACVRAFLDRMKAYGYKTGIYTSASWYQYNLDFSQISSETIWVASWSGRPAYPYYYTCWQYTSKARIPGITQNTTDVSYWFE